MDKVKITQEQANAIESTRRCNADLYIIKKCLDALAVSNTFETIPNISPDTLIRALYIGYEVEETPEDKVREYYKSLKPGEDWEPIDYQKACGVQQTLALLGIKIVGVNHD